MIRRWRRVTVGIFVVTLAVVLVDILGGPQLPGAVRPALPFLLAASLCASLVLGVAAFGAPRTNARDPDEAR